ncbi:CCA tRNA nucleotidyltransferase [Roseococcus sp.]|uniref:CCA tRNA nucleotidyltransferase n=1 Tax=Roseococcus sp. TaxID=2109646 RepID=UPI003BAD7969
MSLPDYLRAEGPRRVFAALADSRAVGGCVRDGLAGLPVRDLDMAAPYPPEVLSERLKAAGFRVFETGLSHGTVTAVLGGVPIEVTSLRRDLVTDGRHAEVEWSTDWREDAERRDFTINAMSMGADGLLHDYFGGAADLAAHRVRFVGDAAQRLREDYLRALRFFRFQARYGGPEPDPTAVQAVREAVPGLARLSVERVWSELKRLMEAEDPRAALRLMIGTGVLPAVLPEAGDPSRLDLALARGVTDVLLRFAMLLPAGVNVTALASRLKFSGEEAARLRALHAIAEAPGPEERDPVILRRFRAAARLRSEAALPAEILLVAAAQHPERDYGPLLDRLEPGPGPAFPVQGRDAIALGVPHGPRIGQLLGQLRAWWLESGASAGHAACLEKLRQLVEEGAS